MHRLRGIDLVLRQEGARRELEDVEPASDLGAHDHAVVPVHRPRAGQLQVLGVLRATVVECDLHGVLGVREVEHRDAALIPGLHHDVASRHGNERAIVGHAVLGGGLSRRELVVALELHLPVLQGEDGVGSPFLRIGGAALGAHATAPFVREDHLAAVVVERRRVPVREVRVRHGGHTHRRDRVADVEEQAVALARTAGVADARVERDVVALRRAWARAAGGARLLAHHAVHHRLQARAERRAICGGRVSRSAARLHDAVQHGLGEPVGQDLHVAVEVHEERALRLRRGQRLFGVFLVRLRQAVRFGLGQVIEDARAAHDRGLLRMREWHLDHFDAEKRRVRVRGGCGGHATGQLGIWTDRGRARDVDVHVLGVFGVHEDRVRVRATARLHRRDLPRILDVGNVEDSEPLEALLARGVLDAAGGAVKASFVAFTGDEREVLVRRHIGLRPRAVVGRREDGGLRIRDVPDLPAVERALEDLGAVEREVRIDAVGELLARARGRDEVQVPDRLASVPAAGLEADPRIRRRRHRAHRLGADRLRGERARHDQRGEGEGMRRATQQMANARSGSGCEHGNVGVGDVGQEWRATTGANVRNPVVRTGGPRASCACARLRSSGRR